jgi:hypothetical protein
MGTWGTGVFDNDEALDLMGDIEDADSLTPLIRACKNACRAKYMETDQCSAVLVTAYIAVWQHGRLPPDLVEVAPGLPQPDHWPLLPDRIVEQTPRAMDRMFDIDTSELYDCWSDAESEHFQAWKDRTERLRTALEELDG